MRDDDLGVTLGSERARLKKRLLVEDTTLVHVLTSLHVVKGVGDSVQALPELGIKEVLGVGADALLETGNVAVALRVHALHGGGGTITGRMLSEEERHIGGMSNGIEGRGADEWPKVKHGRQALRDLLHGLPQDATEAQIADRLFDLLT